MKKIYTIFVAMVLLAAVTATSQIVRGDKGKKQSQKPKTEQTQKQNRSSKTKQNKSSKQNKPQNQHQNTDEPKVQEPTAYDVSFTCNVASATMYIDGNNYGTPDGTRTLKTGKHNVKLTAKDYNDFTTTIHVEKGKTSFNFEMTKKQPQSVEPAHSTQSINQPILHSIPSVVQKAIDDMVFVEGGTFKMGATREQKGDAEYYEKPAHEVYLSSFFIGRTEVTQGLWLAVMGNNPSHFMGDLNCPVENVSWDDCQIFITKLNQMTGKSFRLPTEAEWEYAARGGNKSQGYKYAGSNDILEVAWNQCGKTYPVGTKKSNELGIYDMSGNVREWCQDCHWFYEKNMKNNPIQTKGFDKVYRGGGWDCFPKYCRVSFRGYNVPTFKEDYLGFRLAL